MSLTTSEIESVRAHLGHGNINIGGYPYTPDGFQELFTQVIGPYLSTGTETSATTAITANTIAVVTPVVMTSIVAGAQLLIDSGDDMEIVSVKAVAATTFTARFLKAHAATGYQVMVMSGLARLRILLQYADKAWEKCQSSVITSTAGLKSVGNGEIEWFGGGKVLTESKNHYMSIVNEIARLLRTGVAEGPDAKCSALEVY